MANAENYEGSYYCKAVASGGVEATDDGWQGVPLNTKFSDFVLKISLPDFTEFEEQKKAAGNRVLYRATIIEQAGQAQIYSNCEQTSLPSELRPYSEIDGENGLRCEAIDRTIRVRFDTMRFMDSYGAGYIEGHDRTPVTPSVTVGTCTKVP
ncbi:hypothetical protein D9M69_548180 [compost metagenome]